MLIADPSWTAKNLEDITQFVFEKFKTPGLCIMDAALATYYAYGGGSGACTVIDVGYEKVDVTAITEFMVASRGTVPNSGGECMTQHLKKLLQCKMKNFTRDMAEQLKRSAICEVLLPGTPLPGTDSPPEDIISNPAAAASTGATASGPEVRVIEGPRGPGPDTEVGEEDDNLDNAVDDDGVLDVASIVASGRTQEFLARKEQEKLEKATARKAAKDAREAAEAAAAKPVRLPNSKRPFAIFHYEGTISDAANAKKLEAPAPASAVVEEAPALSVPGEAKPAEDAAPSAVDDELTIVVDAPPSAIDAPPSAIEAPSSSIGVLASPSEAAAAPTQDEAGRREQQKAARKEEKRKAREEERPGRLRQDLEIGLERFKAAEGFLDTVADSVYRVISSVGEISKRQDCWDELIICGNGSKVRGFKDALVATLNNRYLVSPSSATMFMSELPSNLATPSGTGSMTPNPSISSTPHQVPSASAVNPLLLAATTASNPALNANMSTSLYNGHQPTHSSHSQSPTAIKTASPKNYFPEWKSFEEAVFLGAQIAAKVYFVVDQGNSKAFLSRVEFNEAGPSAIHDL